MNYIDILSPSINRMFINTKLEDMQAESWITNWDIYADGSDSIVVSFDTEFGDIVIEPLKYCQRLTFNAPLDMLKNQTMYNVVGTAYGKIIYRGKLFVTDKDFRDYKTNDTDYKTRPNPNNFIILD